MHDSGFTLFGRRIHPNSAPPAPVKSEPFLFKDSSSEAVVEGPRTKDSAKAEKASTLRGSNEEDDETESSGSEQEKSMKKPDKIIPCPRCNSWETKFCYFNNYNVNQPRHFCKNCQRYWTAGGMMRSVPVGAGRRKNKHLASQYRHILISSDGTPSCTFQELAQSQNANETIIKFGPSSVHNGEVPSSMTLSRDPNQVQVCPAPMLAAPGFYTSSIPVHFVPASYWGCIPLWPSRIGTLPLKGSGGCLSSPLSTSNSCWSGEGSPTLGKHGRDMNSVDMEKPEKCIVVARSG